MSMPEMTALGSHREVQGMRADYTTAVKDLMTVMRVLPDDYYPLVMENETIDKGAVFSKIVRRFHDPEQYEPSPADATKSIIAIIG